MKSTHESRDPARLLRRALVANALFSTASTGTCLFFAKALAPTLGVPEGSLFSLGIELAVFAGLVFFLSRADFSRLWARFAAGAVIAGDLLWVAASAMILVGPNTLTATGWWTVLAVAVVVADFAVFQALGLHRLGRRREDRTPGKAVSRYPDSSPTSS